VSSSHKFNLSTEIVYMNWIQNLELNNKKENIIKKKVRKEFATWAGGSHFGPPRPLARAARPLPPYALYHAGPSCQPRSYAHLVTFRWFTGPRDSSYARRAYQADSLMGGTILLAPLYAWCARRYGDDTWVWQVRSSSLTDFVCWHNRSTAASMRLSPRIPPTLTASPQPPSPTSSVIRPTPLHVAPIL
jgi:hypothetical protein